MEPFPGSEEGVIMAVIYSPYRQAGRVARQPQFRQGPRLASVDLYRTEDQYVLSADLPGIDPGSVDVDVDGRVLTIRARRTPAEIEGVTWISQERPSGAFVRKFSLGDGVDADNIAADYANGVLTVTIPVAEKAKPRKVLVSGAGEAVEPAAE